MNYVIEKNVPHPTNRNNQKFPLREMAVGDSFLYPSKDRTKLTCAITYQKKTSDAVFITRAVDGGIRVWRIA